MNVVIAEDETLAAERLHELLKECEPQANILEKVDSVEDLSNFFKNRKDIDLLLLDIQLSDGKSFELFDKINVDVPIIFTTAFDQYALQAFKFQSIDYLLKPIQREDLCNALQKFKRFSKSNGLRPDELALLKQIIQNGKAIEKERLLIKAGNKLQFKNVDEVAYFFADGKLVYLVTKKENRKFLIDYSLEELENTISRKLFFRISRKHIINIDSILEVKGLMGSRLEVKLNQPSDQDLTVSRERVSDFKLWLDQ